MKPEAKPDFLIPDWPAPPNVHARVTTRAGGVSVGPYASFNLGDHVGDDPTAVAANRTVLRQLVPAEPIWLNQVHGIRCVDAAAVRDTEADASFTRAPNTVCAVLTADCLPLLLCNKGGTVVAAAHAGWRGLAAGVIEAAVAAMGVPAESLLTWLGPAIGPDHFEVGGEVRELFMAHDAAAAEAFRPRPNGKWLCDIYALARQRLAGLGVRRSFGGNEAGAGFCTVRERERFYSYRRDGTTGRFASLIWIG